MKKKICLLLFEILLVTLSSCACSAGQETDKTTESRSDAPTGTVTPDLIHNGIAEEICLTDINDGAGQRLEIRENDKLIASEEGYSAHAGWTSLFLCTLDGEDYLMSHNHALPFLIIFTNSLIVIFGALSLWIKTCA